MLTERAFFLLIIRRVLADIVIFLVVVRCDNNNEFRVRKIEQL